MQVTKFLHKLLFSALSEMHKTRLFSLMCTVASLLDQGTLTLTALGRNMSGCTLVKHKIKRVDRLLGNQNLFAERFYIYKSLSANVLKNLSEATIIIDWSGCCSQQRWILQASLAMSGRSIPIYKEIHPLKHISNQAIERQFLHNLYEIVPKHLKVTIVTDAGFKTPWFKAIQELGWDFVGRIRGQMQLNFIGNLWYKATFFNNKIPYNKPKYLGRAQLGKVKKLISANIYGYNTPSKGRKKKRRKYYNDDHPDKNEKYGRANREPWILATSLPGDVTFARRVVNIYKSRMQIEQNFRDIKNQRWGFGLRESRTEDMKRLEILLIIGFIATLTLWLIAIIAENGKFHHGFQANTKRDGRAISLFNLGWQIIKHGLNGNCHLTPEKSYELLEGCHMRMLG